jgi:uncharacterized protein (TIGR02646 family)
MREGDIRMIKLERGATPEGFEQFAQRGLAAAKAFFTVPLEARRQAEFDFRSVLTPDFMELIANALNERFHCKCAYCETPLFGQHEDNVDWFRPRRGVAEDSGKYLGDHYWAQAFAWANLYLSCTECNRSKANRFPVVGTRAPADADRARLQKERPQLLDPAADDPTKHLRFTAEGVVVGLSRRGRTTIETFALNRDSLVAARKKLAGTFLAMPADTWGSLLGPEQPYAGMVRDLARQKPAGDSDRVEVARKSQADFDARRETASTARASSLRQLRARARFIERIEITNIGPISSLTLNLASSASVKVPCFALLGENGAGKSTILKCIALTLAGKKHQLTANVKAKHFIRDGAASGTVRIWQRGFAKPAEMTVTRRSGSFRFSQEESRAFVFAYGSSRLLPTEKNPARRRFLRSSPAKIVNLFDPYLPLTDASKWMHDELPPEHFDDAAKTLRALLPLGSNATFHPARGAKVPVTVRLGDGPPQPFDQLSDGYQSMLGLAADIMQMMYRLGHESMQVAQGVVLIDELGNHLHPRWRRRIVSALRQAFPRVQFIYSTHDPMCLLGLVDGEVAVIRAHPEDGHTYAVENVPIDGLRVDQLLLSTHFGLDSLSDLETEKEMGELSLLSRKTTRERSAPENARFASLRDKLTQTSVLGQSPVERLALQAAEEFLAKAPRVDAGNVDAKAFTREGVDAIADLLQRATGAPAAEADDTVLQQRSDS